MKQNRLKDTLWKRERPAQMAFPKIATLMPPVTTIKGEGFYVEPFLIQPCHWSSSRKRKGHRNHDIYRDRDV